MAKDAFSVILGFLIIFVIKIIREIQGILHFRPDFLSKDIYNSKHRRDSSFSGRQFQEMEYFGNSFLSSHCVQTKHTAREAFSKHRLPSNQKLLPNSARLS